MANTAKEKGDFLWKWENKLSRSSPQRLFIVDENYRAHQLAMLTGLGINQSVSG